MTKSVFQVTFPVRFADCDPDGIAFYPRYFEMINNVVEEWMASMDWSFGYLVKELGDGLPTVNIDCQFLSPSRLGDQLNFTLKVLKLGQSSLTVRIEAMNNGTLALGTTNVLVYRTESKVIPKLLRERMTDYLHES
ncbi:acyl-CoA thioesterase [Pseudomaricurvus alkylphenolicus]|jgi:4-hydroxybenzoyl-CoA thioesterase|uniref:acyl-CoA thioesterase n=1 Tax=Pseudomaricurvus alkylphenolicus TaxID=1306991 RepID=UPI0014204301|nr:acyl-CoA thioesterase [Pseudomaricurvus alkylphenolicus]NIB40401.1 acyl-CoA thioesterase [Pseudomaricurvus alkylphenolicus]